jgi:hypothetical protein
MTPTTRARGGRGSGQPYSRPLLVQAAPSLADQWISATDGSGRTPHNTTAGSQLMVRWRCPVEPAHEWEARVMTRFRGSGCPHCTRLSQGVPPLSQSHPDLASEWIQAVGRNSVGVMPDTVTRGSGVRVRWRCRHDPTHEWEATVRTRLRDTRCPYCSGVRQPPPRVVAAVKRPPTNIADKRPDLAEQWLHPSHHKDAKRNPSNTGLRSAVRVIWRCAASPWHLWEASVSERARGHDCPHCDPLGQAYVHGSIALHVHMRVHPLQSRADDQDICMVLEALPHEDSAARQGPCAPGRAQLIIVRVGSERGGPSRLEVVSAARLLSLAECAGTFGTVHEAMWFATRRHHLDAADGPEAERAFSEAGSTGVYAAVVHSRRPGPRRRYLGFGPRAIAANLCPGLYSGQLALALRQGAPFAIERAHARFGRPHLLSASGRSTPEVGPDRPSRSAQATSSRLPPITPGRSVASREPPCRGEARPDRSRHRLRSRPNGRNLARLEQRGVVGR